MKVTETPDPNKSSKSCVIIPSVRSSTYSGVSDRFARGIYAAINTPDASPTTQDNATNIGYQGMVRIPHPLDYQALYELKDISGHHSSCIQAKKYCTVGLGFVADKKGKDAQPDDMVGMVSNLLKGEESIAGKVDEVLDPLTNFGFLNELLDATEDFMDTGNGYLEVARDDAGTISGISHVPSANIRAMTYKGRLFYEYSPSFTQFSVLGANGGAQYFALFGNKDWLLKEGPLKDCPEKVADPSSVSEIIPFIMPTNRVRYIGYPDWLSACPDIDLLKLAKQYKGDFFANRGVIDKFLLITGEQLNDDAYNAVQSSLGDSVGGGNNFTSMLLNLSSPEATAELLDLGAGDKEEQYAQDVETFTQSIVSSHRVPPLLANILIPGKLGASNEFINSMLAFDSLVILPYQAIFEKMLGKTLGSKSAGLGLAPKDFRLRNITAQISVASMETVGQMRSEVTDPKNSDRDLEKGVKD